MHGQPMPNKSIIELIPLVQFMNLLYIFEPMPHIGSETGIVASGFLQLRPVDALVDVSVAVQEVVAIKIVTITHSITLGKTY